MTTPTPPTLPPPPRPSDVESSTPQWMPLTVAVAALVAAAVMALLWLGARNSGNDAAVERDAAIAERNAANGASIDANAQLRIAQDELAAAQAAIDDGSSSSGQSDGPSPEELQELMDRTEALSAEVERLEDQNETLTADLEAANAEPAPETTVAAPEPTTAPTTTSTTTATTAPPEPSPETTAAAPVSPDDIGDQLSSLFRRSVLGAEQKSCLGQVILNDLGEQRVVEAIAADAPGDDEEFVEALRSAANFCNIDPSAIFG